MKKGSPKSISDIAPSGSSDDDLYVDVNKKDSGNIAISVCQYHSLLAVTNCRFQQYECKCVDPICD